MSVRSSIAPKNSANSTSRTYKVRGGITDKVNRLLGHFWALGANFSASNFPGAAHYFAIHHWEGEMTKPEADALVWVPCDELGTFDLDVDRIAMSEYLWGYEALRRQGTAPHEDAEPVHEALQPGDKVTWWKRMAGGGLCVSCPSNRARSDGKTSED